MVEIKFKRVHENAKLPTNKIGDSGWDVYAVKDTTIVPEDGVVLVQTGLQLAYITPGFEIQVRSRSGNTKDRHCMVANQPGTVDNSYRGPVGVLMWCLRDTTFKAGEKIAQLVPMAIPESTMAWSDEVVETDRGAGGFGSTGR